MKERREISGYNIFVILLILCLTFSSIPVSAEPPHYDYHDTEVDLSTVKAYLNTTIDEMASSMDNGLQVNYSQSYEEEGEGYSYGYINNSYDQERLDLILEKEEEIYSLLVEIKEWSEEIEGEIPSYTHVERYFHPFISLSENLTSFSENHRDFLLQMKQGVETFNNRSAEGMTPHPRDNVVNATVALNRMKDGLSSVETDMENIEDRVGEETFDFTAIREMIQVFDEKISEYEDYLEVMKLRDREPPFLSMRAPATVHPGETIEVEGVYLGGYLFNMSEDHREHLEEGEIGELIDVFDEEGHPLSEDADVVLEEDTVSNIWFLKEDGMKKYRIQPRPLIGEIEELDVYLEEEYTTDENIEILWNGENIATNETRESSYYLTEMEIPPDIEVGLDFELKAVTGEQNVTSGARELKVEKWPAEIELSLEDEKRDFYREEVNISGRFITRAPIDFGDVDLDVEPDTEIEKDLQNFTFRFSQHTEDLDFGENSVNVSYGGTRTMNSTYTRITFNKSIPTTLTISYQENKIQGRLLNASSEEGLEGEEVKLKIDGTVWDVTYTTTDGHYNFTLPTEDITGTQVVQTHFEGDEVFREAESERVEIREPRDDHYPFGIDHPNLLGLLLIGLLFVIGAFVLFYHKKILGIVDVTTFFGGKEDETPSKSTDDRKTLERRHPLQADSEKEISSIYGRLLERLHSEDIIHLEKGNTPRELEREFSSKTDLRDKFKEINSIFEKTIFADSSVTPSELDRFNNSLKKIEKEVL